MAIIEINTNNLATTGRPNEFRGSIALDYETHGNLFEAFLDKHIGNHLKDGKHFVGGKIYLGNSVGAVKNDKISMDFIISNNVSKELFSVTKTIEFTDLLLCFTNIIFQFAHRSEFENDDLNWEAIKNIEEN